MTTAKLLNFIASVPIRGRAAFALALASRALDELPVGTADHQVALEAISTAWRFVEGEPMSALTLNDSFNAVLEAGMGATDPVRAPLNVIGTALGYVTWEAFGVDLATGTVSGGDVPNDMADISEQWVERVYDLSKANSDATLDTLCDRLMEEIERRTSGQSAADLGPPIVRSLAAGKA